MLVIDFSSFPILETERLRLRQIVASDAPQIFFLRTSKETMQYIDRPHMQSLQEATDWTQRIDTMQKNNEGISWAITIKGNNELIGTIGFWKLQPEHYRAEIGYMLHPSYLRKGIMKEAMLKVLEYGFSIGFHSVEANTNVDNKASQKLLEVTGFRQEAYFRENFYYNGQFLDSAIYCILAPKKN